MKALGHVTSGKLLVKIRRFFRSPASIFPASEFREKRSLSPELSDPNTRIFTELAQRHFQDTLKKIFESVRFWPSYELYFLDTRDAHACRPHLDQLLKRLRYRAEKHSIFPEIPFMLMVQSLKAQSNYILFPYTDRPRIIYCCSILESEGCTEYGGKDYTCALCKKILTRPFRFRNSYRGGLSVWLKGLSQKERSRFYPPSARCFSRPDSNTDHAVFRVGNFCGPSRFSLRCRSLGPGLRELVPRGVSRLRPSVRMLHDRVGRRWRRSQPHDGRGARVLRRQRDRVVFRRPSTGRQPDRWSRQRPGARSRRPRGGDPGRNRGKSCGNRDAEAVCARRFRVDRREIVRRRRAAATETGKRHSIRARCHHDGSEGIQVRRTCKKTHMDIRHDRSRHSNGVRNHVCGVLQLLQRVQSVGQDQKRTSVDVDGERWAASAR